MNTITTTEAFSNAPPRSRAVLCLEGPNGTTDMILTEWFTWLNFKRNPMISFSMSKNASLGMNLKENDPFVLAFPPAAEALKYAQGVRTAAEGQEKQLPDGVEPVAAGDLPMQIPKGSEIVLRCTLAGAYNYPFKKVRIFNCNLQEALGNIKSLLDE